MGVLTVLLLAVEAHIVASYDVLENFDAIAAQHHRKRIEGSMFEGNRHRRIERRMNLSGKIHEFLSKNRQSIDKPIYPIPCSISSMRHRVTSLDASVTNRST